MNIFVESLILFNFLILVAVTMSKKLINKDQSQKNKTRPVSFILLALFLLSNCPVKKTINFWLFDNAGLENSALTKKVPTAANRFVLGSEICITSDQKVFTNTYSYSQSSTPLFSLAFFFLLPALSLKALLTKNLHHYFAEVTFFKGLTPIYLKNRRLLI